MKKNSHWYWAATAIAMACTVFAGGVAHGDTGEREAQRETFFEMIAEDIEPQYKLRVYVLINVFEPQIREYFENNPDEWANFDRDAALNYLLNMDWDCVREYLGDRNWNDIQQRLEQLDRRIEEHGWDAVHAQLKALDWEQARDYLEQRR